MKRAMQTAILKACGRYVRRYIAENVTPRLAEVERGLGKANPSTGHAVPYLTKDIVAPNQERPRFRFNHRTGWWE